ncbi:retinol dehydrogenase 14 [Sigmodon hispidus]
MALATVAAALLAALGGTLWLAARRFSGPRGQRMQGSRDRSAMHGKTVLITGANSGLGRATAAELLRLGARVIMGCRDRSRAEEAAGQLLQELGQAGGQEPNASEGQLIVKELDLASLRSVRAFCQELLQEEPRLDVLINNAGVFQCPYMKTEDGFEMQFGVNHLGHFLLTNLLLGLLKSSAPSRIVVVSSKLYKYGDINFEDLNSEQSYNKSFCYSRSKLANILFTKELARRLEGSNVTVNVLHPGIVRTNLGRHIHIPLLARPLFNLVSWAFFKTPLEGAQTSIYLASSPEVEGVSGRYFGDCKEEELLPKAMDESVARKLWDISEVMIVVILVQKSPSPKSQSAYGPQERASKWNWVVAHLLMDNSVTPLEFALWAWPCVFGFTILGPRPCPQRALPGQLCLCAPLGVSACPPETLKGNKA